MAMNDDMGLVFSGEMGLGLYLFSVVHLMNITHRWCSGVRPVFTPGPSGYRRNDRVKDYRALGASWDASTIATKKIYETKKTGLIIITPLAFFLLYNASTGF